MLIETTVPFDTKEEAQDSLAGTRTMPGFIFGYVRAPYKQGNPYDVINLFDCNHTYTENPVATRLVENLTVNELSRLAWPSHG